MLETASRRPSRPLLGLGSLLLLMALAAGGGHPERRSGQQGCEAAAADTPHRETLGQSQQGTGRFPRAGYPAGGDRLSKRSVAGSTQAQLGAADLQIVLAGRATTGPSSDPARMTMSRGHSRASTNSCVPQAEQKFFDIWLPLSAR